MDTDDWSEARARDRAFLGFASEAGLASAVISERLETPDGRLYGGAALALAIAAMEDASGRRLLWATTQFVGTAGRGDRLDLETEVLAEGRASSQLQVSAHCAGRLVFRAVGATGVERPAGISHTFLEMPSVPAPSDLPTSELPLHAAFRNRGHIRSLEYRRIDDDSRLWSWIRATDHRASQPAMLAYIADYLPLALMIELGLLGGGTSLDNTIRIGEPLDCEWVLVECRAEQATGGYGHGSVRLWSPDGVLLGVASQTSTLRPVVPG